MKRTRSRRLALWLLGSFSALALVLYLSFKLSPWPATLLIRAVFARGAADQRAKNAALVPPGITAQRDLSYAPDDPDARFDVFAPAAPRRPLPALVWMHGGGFVAGARSDLHEYLQVVASRGFVTVAIGYSLAPRARFPTPVQQLNVALAFLTASASRFGIDPERVFLGGDSAGAQIAAQTALVITGDRPAGHADPLAIAPGIARAALRGLVLFCGPYDPATLSYDGAFGAFMRTVVEAYLGVRDLRDPRVAQLSVTPHVTPGYPAVFISVGNDDALGPQSHALARALRAQGVEVDALFFPDDHQPPLAHEYQLQLWTEAGRLALERTVAFMHAHAR